jgi:hypothetical protein
VGHFHGPYLPPSTVLGYNDLNFSNQPVWYDDYSGQTPNPNTLSF